jgi:hypothetical protein
MMEQGWSLSVVAADSFLLEYQVGYLPYYWSLLLPTPHSLPTMTHLTGTGRLAYCRLPVEELIVVLPVGYLLRLQRQSHKSFVLDGNNEKEKYRIIRVLGFSTV